ncbi:hypothetical protein B0H10DRAFT_2200543 [Mycena sp. CBHHK59/15]|nr:hypothetical protein B0H10DRAFT_2200543 [Mycena sp. CBHHK59/15]
MPPTRQWMDTPNGPAASHSTIPNATFYPLYVSRYIPWCRCPDDMAHGDAKSPCIALQLETLPIQLIGRPFVYYGALIIPKFVVSGGFEVRTPKLQVPTLSRAFCRVAAAPYMASLPIAHNINSTPRVPYETDDVEEAARQAMLRAFSPSGWFSLRRVHTRPH